MCKALEVYLAQDVDDISLFKAQLIFIRGIESKRDLTVLFCWRNRNRTFITVGTQMHAEAHKKNINTLHTHRHTHAPAHTQAKTGACFTEHVQLSPAVIWMDLA